MPNWSEGVLKVRGTREKILKFLKEGIAYCDYKYERAEKGFKEIEVPRECPFKSDEYEVFIQNTRELWVKGTRRMFISSKNIEAWWSSYDDDEEEVIALDVKQAWAIIADNLLELSQKYGLDFRIFATERGMEFCQLVEVIDGKVTRDEEIKFDDFVWEAPDHRLGG